MPCARLLACRAEGEGGQRRESHARAARQAVGRGRAYRGAGAAERRGVTFFCLLCERSRCLYMRAVLAMLTGLNWPEEADAEQ